MYIYIYIYIYIYTVDSAFSGHCVKRTTVLSGQIFRSRQNMPLFQYKTLCVKRTSALCGQRTDFLKIWSRFSVLSGQDFKCLKMARRYTNLQQFRDPHPPYSRIGDCMVINHGVGEPTKWENHGERGPTKWENHGSCPPFCRGKTSLPPWFCTPLLPPRN